MAVEKERRKSPRVPVEVNLRLCRDEKVEKKSKGIIKNITLDGLCVETDLPASVGSDLVFSLDTPCEFKFNIFGKIIWQEKKGDLFRYGTKFTKLEMTEKPDLYKFILVTMCLNEHQ
jgi:hypothetical protein